MYGSTLKCFRAETLRRAKERWGKRSAEQHRSRNCLSQLLVSSWSRPLKDAKQWKSKQGGRIKHGRLLDLRLCAQRLNGDVEPDLQKGDQDHLKKDDIPPAKIWEVPWDNWATAQMMVQIWAVMLPLGFLSVSVATQLVGAPLSPDAKVFTVLGSELLQLVLVLVLIQRFTARFDPLGPTWFCYKEDSAAAAWGVVGGGASLLAVVGLTALAASKSSEATGNVAQILRDGSTWTAVAFLVTSAAVAPAVEEYVYRGFLLPSLTRDLPVPASVVISAALFSASHLSAADGVRLFVLGLVLSSVSVAARGNLTAPTLAHSLYNLAIATSLLLAG